MPQVDAATLCTALASAALGAALARGCAPSPAPPAASKCPAKSRSSASSGTAADPLGSVPANSSATLPGAEPDVEIEYCVGCKWNLRAAWMAQELLSTFCSAKEEDERLLRSVALVPSMGLGGGVFRVRVGGTQVWDRKTDGALGDAPISMALVSLVALALDDYILSAVPSVPCC